MITRFFIRLTAAIAAFRAAKLPPAYAVIYDEVPISTSGELVESFYEMFATPQEAAEMFRTAFPNGSFVDEPRLVLIMGGIDEYR